VSKKKTKKSNNELPDLIPVKLSYSNATWLSKQQRTAENHARTTATRAFQSHGSARAGGR
jgi:hypothetical protein